MIPRLFVKDNAYPHYSMNPAPIPGIGVQRYGVDFVAQQQKLLSRTHSEMQANSNMDSLLQAHRRKMQRRAANRRSAQLSRARKKAHLEELKIEISRLQRLVDAFESQPELVFCITASGGITHISERTVSFIKINSTTDDSLEDPTHLSQILSRESAESVLQTLQKLNSLTTAANSDEETTNVIFTSKKVYFRDVFGQPLVGFLRCSKIFRRSALQDVSAAESVDGSSETAAAMADPNQSADSQPRAKSSGASKSQAKNSNGSQIRVDNLGIEEWNLTNFKMLTDCVSNLAPRELPACDSEIHNTSNCSYRREQESASSEKTSLHSGTAATSSSASSSSSTLRAEAVTIGADVEFVCVIRTSENHFVPCQSQSDLYMFSTQLSTASMSAHDQKHQSSSNAGRESPNGSRVSSSNHSSDQQPESSLSTSASGRSGDSKKNVSDVGSDDVANDY